MTEVRARRAGIRRDLGSVAGRAIRAIPRDLESVIPALLIPVFWMIVSVGALETVAEGFLPGLDFRAFQLPVAVIFAVTGVSRAYDLVLDIRSGYFDRLSITPVSRPSLLLGMMMALSSSSEDMAWNFLISAFLSSSQRSMLEGLQTGLRFSSANFLSVS